MQNGSTYSEKDSKEDRWTEIEKSERKTEKQGTNITTAEGTLASKALNANYTPCLHNAINHSEPTKDEAIWEEEKH